MATSEQRAASLAVMNAVTALNRAFSECLRLDMHVDLEDVRPPHWSVPKYIVSTIEIRETVLPEGNSE